MGTTFSKRGFTESDLNLEFNGHIGQIIIAFLKIDQLKLFLELFPKIECIQFAKNSFFISIKPDLKID